MPEEPKQESPGTDSERWHRYELLLANFQAVGKSQTFFTNSLLLFIIAVIALELLHQSGGISIQVLGATVQIRGLWQIVPLIAGVLCLGFIGTVNLMHHAWRRLDLCVMELFSKSDFFFTEFDCHKNILDYLACLTLSLRKPVLPDTAEVAKHNDQKWGLGDASVSSISVCIDTHHSIYAATNCPHSCICDVRGSFGALTVTLCNSFYLEETLPLRW